MRAVTCAVVVWLASCTAATAGLWLGEEPYIPIYPETQAVRADTSLFTDTPAATPSRGRASLFVQDAPLADSGTEPRWSAGLPIFEGAAPGSQDTSKRTPLDADDLILGNAYTWMDGSATEQDSSTQRDLDALEQEAPPPPTETPRQRFAVNGGALLALARWH